MSITEVNKLPERLTSRQQTLVRQLLLVEGMSTVQMIHHVTSVEYPTDGLTEDELVECIREVLNIRSKLIS